MKRIHACLLGAVSLLLTVSATVPTSAFRAPMTHAHAAAIHPEVQHSALTAPEALQHVIVHTTAGRGEHVLEQASQLGAVITAKWDFIHSFAADIRADQLTELAALPDVLWITQEQNVQSSHTSVVDSSAIANAYNFAVKADQVWARGVNGSGVAVAVIDSGVNETLDLKDRVIGRVKFNSTAPSTPDKYGHGTHVAGIIAGNGSSSNGKYIGIAPGVNLINVKFSDDEGKASEKDLVTALQWVYDNHKTYNIRVANISSSVGAKQSYRESAVAAAVEQLWFAGVVVVVSAGNKGEELCSTCYAPANDPFVITVGATDDHGTAGILDDQLKPWSSSGLTLDGHSKPDIVAPGARMVSFMPDGNLRTAFPQNIVDTSYFRMGGTSMAAPVVSGIAALMLQAHPEWTPNQVKWVLMQTTRPYLLQPLGTPGIVNAEAAVFYPYTPGYANQGLLTSPFIDNVTGAITNLNVSWGNVSWGNVSWGNSIAY